MRLFKDSYGFSISEYTKMLKKNGRGHTHSLSPSELEERDSETEEALHSI